MTVVPFSHQIILSKFGLGINELGLINNNDETAYRNEVRHLALWCDNNRLVLNIKQTKEIIVDFCKTGQYKHFPLSNGIEVVERVTE